MKKITRNYHQIFCKIFFIKHFSQQILLKNTYQFYNFVENNYSRRNYLQLKFLKKIARKHSFLTENCNLCKIKVFNSDLKFDSSQS